MPLKLASARSIIYIYFLLKSAEKCQFQNTRKLDASTPLYYPEMKTIEPAKVEYIEILSGKLIFLKIFYNRSRAF